jgi:hypothetical protein
LSASAGFEPVGLHPKRTKDAARLSLASKQAWP